MFRYELVNSTRKFTIVAEIVSLLKKIYKRDAPFRAVFKVKTLAVLFSAYPREMKHIPRNLNLPPFCRCLFLWKWCNPFPRARARLKHAHSFDRCGARGRDSWCWPKGARPLAKGLSDADEVGGYVFAIWGVVPNYFPPSIPSSRACRLSCSLVQKDRVHQNMDRVHGPPMDPQWTPDPLLWTGSMDSLFFLALKIVVIKDYECVLRLWYNLNSCLLLKSLYLQTAKIEIYRQKACRPQKLELSEESLQMGSPNWFYSHV